MTIHPMTVTSPLTHGPEVARRQRLLHNNKLRQDFMGGGTVDGEYGPETGRAVIRAKFWCGYLQKDMTPIYGPYLDAFLRGTPLPADLAKRRSARLSAKNKRPLRLKALDNAVGDIGMKESPPRSNWSPISRRWGVKGAWCAMGVSTWYIDAGSKAFVMHRDWAYVPFMLAAAEHGQDGLAIVRFAQALPGDILCFDWDDDGVADHTGLLREVTVPSRDFKTVEANTGIGNDSNGGRVMERERAIGQLSTFNGLAAVIRVGR